MTALAALERGELTEVGWTPSPDLTFEDWRDTLDQIARAGKAIQWAIGDAINFGMVTYGEKYMAAVEATGYEYQTLANMAWVASVYDFSFRKENLSWAHHHYAASLDPSDRERVLADAEKYGWSAHEMRAQIKQLAASEGSTTVLPVCEVEIAGLRKPLALIDSEHVRLPAGTVILSDLEDAVKKLKAA